jgi:hypothetical protein
VALFERAERGLGGGSDPDAQAAASAAGEALGAYRADGELPSPGTANALRAIVASDADAGLVDDANAILGPADNYGGKISFRYVAPLCAILLLVFGVMYARDRSSGGYRVERIGAA